MSRETIKPGILCYLTDTGVGNDGKVVEVLRRALDYELLDGPQTYWWVMCSSPMTFVFVTGFIGEIPITTFEERSGEVIVGERYLCPISDPDLEIEDERAIDRTQMF